MPKNNSSNTGDTIQTQEIPKYLIFESIKLFNAKKILASHRLYTSIT